MLYRRMNTHGGDVYEENIDVDFSANSNAYGVPPDVLNQLQNSLPQISQYPDPYCRELIQALSEYENLPAKYILCGNGAAELIYAFCDAVKPKCVLELAPTFSEYTASLQDKDCHIERHLLRKEEDFSVNDSLLTTLINKRPDVVFLCNPNNPTGRLIEPSLLEKILKICEAENIFCLLDECFIELSDRNEEAITYLASNSQLFILKAFTKSYALAGLRLGYCLSSNEKVLENMSKAVQPWNVSLLAQIAGVAVTSQRDYLEETKKLLHTQRKWLKSELERIGIWVCPSDTNYLLFQGPEHLDKSLREHRISIRNCDIFPGLSSGWYRIAVRTPEENRLLIETIRKVI